MTDEELVEFAREFRKGIMGAYTNSTGFCGMICWPLETLLCMNGVQCKSVETDLGMCNHVWLRLEDGRVLDPTMDQFNFLFAEDWPDVYLGPPTKYHDAGS